MDTKTLLKFIIIILIVGVITLMYGNHRMKHNFDSDYAQVYITEADGSKSINNHEPARFTVVQSYLYNLNNSIAVVRITVIRDVQTGDEYMITRDPDSGLVVTKLSSTGH